MELIQPQEIEVRGKRYNISKFPAVAGREIIQLYPVANIPKIGDLKESKTAMLMLMQYVEAFCADGTPVRLTTETLVNNHVPDWETLVTLEKEMLVYNCSFFQHGSLSAFLSALRNGDAAKIIEMLTPLLDRLSPAVKQHFMN